MTRTTLLNASNLEAVVGLADGDLDSSKGTGPPSGDPDIAHIPGLEWTLFSVDPSSVQLAIDDVAFY